MISLIQLEPRYAETDQMGIIHHSNYAIYYEMGRVQFCKDMGVPFDMIEKRGLRLALTKIKSQFKKPLLFGHMYQLHTKLISFSKVKMTFKYMIIDESNDVMHIGYTDLAWLNQELKPVNMFKYDETLYQMFKHVEENENEED